MQIRDHKKIAKLMVIQGVSQRQLARAVGWESHSIAGRLIRGEIRSVTPDKAALISKFLGVGVDDLFLVKSSTIPDRHDKIRETAA